MRTLRRPQPPAPSGAAPPPRRSPLFTRASGPLWTSELWSAEAERVLASQLRDEPVVLAVDLVALRLVRVRVKVRVRVRIGVRVRVRVGVKSRVRVRVRVRRRAAPPLVAPAPQAGSPCWRPLRPLKGIARLRRYRGGAPSRVAAPVAALAAHCCEAGRGVAARCAAWSEADAHP